MIILGYEITKCKRALEELKEMSSDRYYSQAKKIEDLQRVFSLLLAEAIANSNDPNRTAKLRGIHL